MGLDYTTEELAAEIEQEIALEYGIPTSKEEEVLTSSAMEAGDYSNVFDFVQEATKSKMSKAQFMKVAKEKALQKFKKTRKYKKATKDMSNSEKKELDRKLRAAMDKKQGEADSLWLKHPWTLTFFCVFFLGWLGVVISSVCLADAHYRQRRGE